MNNKEYTRKEFPAFWVSLKTGNKFDYKTHTTHEYPKQYGPAAGLLCLPVDEYPYTIEYQPTIYKWKAQPLKETV